MCKLIHLVLDELQEQNYLESHFHGTATYLRSQFLEGVLPLGSAAVRSRKKIREFSLR